MNRNQKTKAMFVIFIAMMMLLAGCTQIVLPQRAAGTSSEPFYPFLSETAELSEPPGTAESAGMPELSGASASDTDPPEFQTQNLTLLINALVHNEQQTLIEAEVLKSAAITPESPEDMRRDTAVTTDLEQEIFPLAKDAVFEVLIIGASRAEFGYKAVSLEDFTDLLNTAGRVENTQGYYLSGFLGAGFLCEFNKAGEIVLIKEQYAP